MNQPSQTRQIVFFERVYPSVMAISPSVLLTPAVALVVLPFLSTLVAVLVGALCTTLMIVILLTTAPVIAVYDHPGGRQLQVGRARIPLTALGSARIVEPAERRVALGTGLSSLAYLRLQTGVSTLVQLEVADPTDVTPYWMFSTRRPQQLLNLLKI